MQRQVVLVDEQDNDVGTEDILVAHQGKGIKHRALSVILYRDVGKGKELLLQKRSGSKPVFRHLWSNTTCTNMRLGDKYLERAVERLDEEMGIRILIDKLKLLYRFSYEAQDNERPGWCENELDTVIVGEWDGEVYINKEEAEDYKWMKLDELRAEIDKYPNIYAPWYRMILDDKRFRQEVG